MSVVFFHLLFCCKEKPNAFLVYVLPNFSFCSRTSVPYKKSLQSFIKRLFFFPLRLNCQFSKFHLQKLDTIFLNKSHQDHQTHRKQIWKRLQEFTFLLGVASHIIFLQRFFQYPFSSVSNFNICMSKSFLKADQTQFSEPFLLMAGT